MDKLRDLWDEVHPVMKRVILAELCILAVLLVMLIGVSVARGETSSTACGRSPFPKGEGQEGTVEYVCVVHKGEWVWIRETPDASGRKIGRVRYGYEIEAAQPEKGYMKISVRPAWLLDGEHASEGYVDASYFLSRVPEKMYRVICEGPLAKRETPQGRLMCWIKPGSKISVLGYRYDKDGALWAAVYKGGYVKASFLAEL